MSLIILNCVPRGRIWMTCTEWSQHFSKWASRSGERVVWPSDALWRCRFVSTLAHVMSDDIKPLPEPMLTPDYWVSVAFARKQFHSEYQSYYSVSWWRHQMETFSALLAICAENSPVPGEFPTQRPVTRSFDITLICARIKGWVNNRKAGDLRRHQAHCDVIVM